MAVVLEFITGVAVVTVTRWLCMTNTLPVLFSSQGHPTQSVAACDRLCLNSHNAPCSEYDLTRPPQQFRDQSVKHMNTEHMDKQIDRYTDRQVDRQTGRQTDR